MCFTRCRALGKRGVRFFIVLLQPKSTKAIIAAPCRPAALFTISCKMNYLSMSERIMFSFYKMDVFYENPSWLRDAEKMKLRSHGSSEETKLTKVVDK